MSSVAAVAAACSWVPVVLNFTPPSYYEPIRNVALQVPADAPASGWQRSTDESPMPVYFASTPMAMRRRRGNANGDKASSTTTAASVANFEEFEVPTAVGIRSDGKVFGVQAAPMENGDTYSQYSPGSIRQAVFSSTDREKEGGVAALSVDVLTCRSKSQQQNSTGKQVQTPRWRPYSPDLELAGCVAMPVHDHDKDSSARFSSIRYIARVHCAQSDYNNEDIVPAAFDPLEGVAVAFCENDRRSVRRQFELLCVVA